MILYLIGSLRNPEIPVVAQTLRRAGHEVFDDWHAAGPEADDWWKEYEKARGRTLPQALNDYAAMHVFEFDRKHLNRCDGGVLVLPAGRSAHLELGYLAGQGKPTYVLLDGDPDRWDVMYGFTDGVFTTLEELVEGIQEGVPF